MESEGIRTFIAVPLSEDITRKLSEVQVRLGRQIDRVKWVPPENLHITLKFLGNVPQGMLGEIGRAMISAASGMRPFRVTLRGIGGFYQGNSLRVIWAGIQEGKGELAELWERLESALGTLGFKGDDRGFVPHVTLGRVKEGGRASMRVLAGYEGMDFGAMTASSLRLMKSQLERRGAVYSVLHEVTF